MPSIRLVILGSSPCDRCTAACCKQAAHAQFVVLLEGEERRRFAPFARLVPIEHDGRRTVEAVLPYVEGRCQFLGDDDRCTIYEERPLNCRRFECIHGFHNRGVTIAEHDRFLCCNPAVAAMLQEL